MPQVITVKEAADRLEVCKSTVVRAVRNGELRATFAGLHKNRISGIYAESVEAIRTTAGRK